MLRYFLDGSVAAPARSSVATCACLKPGGLIILPRSALEVNVLMPL